MPISESEANKIFDVCDANKDGNVTKLELLKGLTSYFQKSISVEAATVSFIIQTCDLFYQHVTTFTID